MVGKYLHIARIAARHTWAGKSALVGRVGLLAVLMLVFSRIWQAAFARGAGAGLGASDLTWYMTLTELVTLAVPMLHLDIEQEVRSGDVAAQLPRPCNYLWAQVAKGLGSAFVQLGVLAFAGFFLTWGLSGSLPARWDALFIALPLTLLAVTVNVLFVASIGIGSFWIQECGPLYWVWQKALFVLGGLILPLSFYPEWLQSFAAATPFSAILHGPASLMLAPPTLALTLIRLGKLLGWGFVAVLLAQFLYGRALKALDVNGG